MSANVVLGHAGWLVVGKLRWARVLLWLLVLGALCILTFNLATDSILRLYWLIFGEAFTSRAHSPPGASLLAVVFGSVAMFGV